MEFRNCWGGWLDKIMLPVHLCLSSQFGGSSVCYSNMYTAIKSSSLELNEITTSAVAMFSKKAFYSDLQTSYVKSLLGR